MYFVLFVLGVTATHGLGTSVSGLSSGGYMATQYQFAFGDEIVGAGVFAAGPYYCAQNTLYRALSDCMTAPTLISLPTLYTATQNFASRGDIAPLDSLHQHKVYMFSGTKDYTVFPGVVKKLEEEYKNYAVANLVTNFDSGAGHSFPTDSFGNSCGSTESPYITNCGIDGAGDMLKTIYGALKPRVPQIEANIKKMNIDQFTNGASPSSISMDSVMYYYEPQFCNGNCTVHLALHGCKMTYSDIQLAFVRNAGYNTWAEANSMVVLYPFAVKGSGNPNGCWDWWGYLSGDYAIKKGAQMITLHNIVKYFENPHK